MLLKMNCEAKIAELSAVPTEPSDAKVCTSAATLRRNLTTPEAAYDAGQQRARTR